MLTTYHRRARTAVLCFVLGVTLGPGGVVAAPDEAALGNAITLPPAPGVSPPDALTWSAFVSDVLSVRLMRTMDERISVEFFASLLRAVSYGAPPDTGGPYTLFLPTDGAFSRHSGETLDAVIHDRSALRSLVKSHIVPGTILASDLQPGSRLVSLDGGAISAEYVGRPFVNGAAVIGSAELEHGVVHFVDRLLDRSAGEGALPSEAPAGRS
jgi:hypothetical protein